jgi:hypothetical protein
MSFSIIAEVLERLLDLFCGCAASARGAVAAKRLRLPRQGTVIA